MPVVAVEQKPIKPRAQRFINSADMQNWRRYRAIITALGQRIVSREDIKREVPSSVAEIKKLYREADLWTRRELNVSFYALPENADYASIAKAVSTEVVKRERDERLQKTRSKVMKRLRKNSAFVAMANAEATATARTPAGKRQRSKTMKRLQQRDDFAKTRDQNMARINANPAMRAKALATRLKNGKHKLPKRKRRQVLSALMRGLATAQIRERYRVGRENIQRIAREEGIVPATKTSPVKFLKAALPPPLCPPDLALLELPLIALKDVGGGKNLKLVLF